MSALGKLATRGLRPEYKGDKVVVTKGKDEGKVGIVKKVLRDQNRLLVEGVNLVKKHVKSTEDFKGGIFTKEAPVHYSNVALIDPQTGKPCSISMRYLEDGTKVRVSKSSGLIINKPEPTAYLKKKQERQKLGEGPKDTPLSIATKQTFKEPSINDLD